MWMIPLLTAESEEELKSLFVGMKKESERASLKLKKKKNKKKQKKN